MKGRNVFKYEGHDAGRVGSVRVGGWFLMGRLCFLRPTGTAAVHGTRNPYVPVHALIFGTENDSSTIQVLMYQPLIYYNLVRCGGLVGRSSIDMSGIVQPCVQRKDVRRHVRQRKTCAVQGCV